MSKILHFTPPNDKFSDHNLKAFIGMCKDEIDVFGKDLRWNDFYWPEAGVSFGNLDQKHRVFAPENSMQFPFVDFAKAYFRYRQGFHPTKNRTELAALRCVERALVNVGSGAKVEVINHSLLDAAASIALGRYSRGTAYSIGVQLEILGRFLSERHLVQRSLQWKNTIPRFRSVVRTGQKAKSEREKKLPSREMLDHIADLFASNPVTNRDIFTTCTAALLLCAPSRITEILSLRVDCELTRKKKDGTSSYGWSYIPGKGGNPMTKPIPSSMTNVAKEAIRRLRALTDEARRLARWLETKPDKFYRHPNCPNVDEDAPLTLDQVRQALGIGIRKNTAVRAYLKRWGIAHNSQLTLAVLNKWIHQRLPRHFPWFDKDRGLKYSDALFCMQLDQLRPDLRTSPCLIWQPTKGVFNVDLGGPRGSALPTIKSIFQRHNLTKADGTPITGHSHQFRHYLNTLAQRGGLAQSEIARWSGRTDVKQNRVYDHMSEFELAGLLRDQDSSLSLDRPLVEIAEQIARHIPMTMQEFNTLAHPTAHITELGFCLHDFASTPCQRFRDCLNCSEQVCIKGDRRLKGLRVQYEKTSELRKAAAKEIEEGSFGADRWFEMQVLTEARLAGLIRIAEDPAVGDGSIIRLRNDLEYSPLRSALETRRLFKRRSLGDINLQELRTMIGDGNG